MGRKYIKRRGVIYFNKNSSAFNKVIRLIGKNNRMGGRVSDKDAYRIGMEVIHKKLKAHKVSKTEIRSIIQTKTIFRTNNSNSSSNYQFYHFPKKFYEILKAILSEIESILISEGEAYVVSEFYNNVSQKGSEEDWVRYIIDEFEEKISSIKITNLKEKDLNMLEYGKNELDKLRRCC